MVEAITFQTIFQFIQTAGIIVGIAYYIMNIQTQRKNQELQLETRQAQLFAQIFLKYSEVDSLINYFTVLNMKWEDYEDYQKKYDSTVNPESAARRYNEFTNFNFVGKLLKEGLIDFDLVYVMMQDTPLYQWDMWKDVIYEDRKQMYDEGWLEYWEYLADKILEKKKELGYEWKHKTQNRNLRP